MDFVAYCSLELTSTYQLPHLVCLHSESYVYVVSFLSTLHLGIISVSETICQLEVTVMDSDASTHGTVLFCPFRIHAHIKYFKMFTELCMHIGNCCSIRRLFGPPSGHYLIAFIVVANFQQPVGKYRSSK